MCEDMIGCEYEFTVKFVANILKDGDEPAVLKNLIVCVCVCVCACVLALVYFTAKRERMNE